MHAGCLQGPATVLALEILPTEIHKRLAKSSPPKRMPPAMAVMFNASFGSHFPKNPLNVKKMSWGTLGSVTPEMSQKCLKNVRCSPTFLLTFCKSVLETQPRPGNVQHAQFAKSGPLEIVRPVCVSFLIAVWPLIHTITNIGNTFQNLGIDDYSCPLRT